MTRVVSRETIELAYVAAGEGSVGQLAQRCAVILAEGLHTSLVQFPGDHGGFLSDPRGFADHLDRVLR